MEAILGANGGAMIGCSRILGEPPCLLASKPSSMQRCDCSVVRKSLAARGGLGIARGGRARWVTSAAPFRDQSHSLFYDVDPHSSRGQSRISSFAMETVSGEVMENDGAEIDKVDLKLRKKMEKKAKKIEKKMRKVARKKEGLSSESSESESEEVKVERSSARRRKNADDWRAELEAVGSSPEMNTILRITAESAIEQPGPLSERVSNATHREGGSKSDDWKFDSVRTPPPRRTADVAGRNEDNFPVARDILFRPETELQTTAATGVEVCLNSNCRKAGSQEVLSAFQAHGVNAVGCSKCMKNCKNAVTVRVGLAEGDTEMHSRVRPEDVKALSQRYFAIRKSSATDQWSYTADSGTRDGRQLARH